MSAHWIGVDLDGTLAVHSGGALDIGEPIAPMVERVKRWLAEGQEVRIFTARVSHGEDRVQRAEIAAWTRRIFGQTLVATCVKDDDCVAIYDDIATGVERNTGRLVGA